MFDQTQLLWSLLIRISVKFFFWTTHPNFLGVRHGSKKWSFYREICKYIRFYRRIIVFLWKSTIFLRNFWILRRWLLSSSVMRILRDPFQPNAVKSDRRFERGSTRKIQKDFLRPQNFVKKGTKISSKIFSFAYLYLAKYSIFDRNRFSWVQMVFIGT